MSRKVNRRAQLLVATMPPPLAQHTLQQHLQGALQPPVDLDATEKASSQFGALRLNQQPQASRRGGIRLKIVGHAPEEHATTVPLRLSTAAQDESAAIPPDQQSFKNGDFFLIVRGNHILGFGDHMRIETAVSFLRSLLATRYQNSQYAALSVSNVFNYDAGQQLAAEGVRAIEFDASLSAAAGDVMADSAFKGPVKRFVGEISEQFKALFVADVDAAQLADVRIGITIGVEGGVRGAELANSAVFSAANQLLDHPENEVPEVAASIRTKQGNSVSLASATVGKLYKLTRRPNENSMIDLDAWEALENFDDHVTALGDLRT